jgi:hypothetical protein
MIHLELRKKIVVMSSAMFASLHGKLYTFAGVFGAIVLIFAKRRPGGSPFTVSQLGSCL